MYNASSFILSTCDVSMIRYLQLSFSCPCSEDIVQHGFLEMLHRLQSPIK